MTRLIPVLLMAGLLCQPAAADDLTPQKREDIKKLMAVTGSANMARQFGAAFSQQMFNAIKASKPDIPDRALAIMNDELIALFSEKLSAPGGLLDLVIPIYDRFFTHQDILDFLTFYESPAGRKAVTLMPQVLSESMAMGQRWGESLGPEIRGRLGTALKREGLLPD